MPNITQTPPTYDATQLVNQGWQFFQGKSGELMNNVTWQLNQIANPLLNMTAPVISFTMPPVEDGTFNRPIAPVEPSIADIDTATPDVPAMTGVDMGSVPALPDEPDFSGMTFRTPAAPSVSVPSRPADIDVYLDDIVVPDAPAMVLPADPTLLPLNLPDIPDMAIPAFDGVRPSLNLTAPPANFSWHYQAYDESTIASVKSQLSTMRLNGLAMPPAIEQAIFDRARGREDVLSAQQISEASRALAGRGLRQPSGLMFRMFDRIKTAARATSSGASRDLAIEVAKENIESIKFGISQAIALESTLLQQHIAVQGLLLDAAKAAQAMLMDAFNAQVALHNAQWEGYKAEAQVYEARLRALATQVDIIKARIDAEKVKGDINEALIRAYAEKVRALSSLSDMYRAQVEAAKAKGEINVQRLEQVRLRLQAYGTDVDAYAKQWDAYAKQAESETAGIRYYEALGNVFSNRVQAVRAIGDIQNQRVTSQIAMNSQQIDLYRAALAGVATRVQAETANAEVKARIFTAKTNLFGTEGQVSASESDAANRTAAMRMEQSKLIFDSASQNARIAADYGIKRAELAIEASRGASQVWGQLAASVLSGVNLGAHTSNSVGMNWSWSGEI